MTRKVTLTLDEDLVAFLDELVAAGHNDSRSGLVNDLLQQERRRQLEDELVAAYRRDAADPAYRAEVAEWDVVVGDGLSA